MSINFWKTSEENQSLCCRLDIHNLGRAVYRTFEKILTPHEKEVFMPFVQEHFPQSTKAGEDEVDHEQHPVVDHLCRALKVKGVWPLLIGPQGVGKSSAVRAAIKSLSTITSDNYELCEVTGKALEHE